MKEKVLQNYFYKFLVLLGSITLIGMLSILLLNFNHIGIWDEDIFRNNSLLFENFGFTNTFLNSIEIQAPGPLYQLIHALFYPITKYQLGLMRVINFILLLITIFVIYRIFIEYKFSKLKSSALASTYLFVPGITGISILAMSEIPTFFFLTVSIYALIKYSKTFLKIYLICFAICFGLTLIGRTTFLSIVPLLILIFYKVSNSNKIPAQLAILVSLIPIAYIIYTWNGLVPPKVAWLETSTVNLNYSNLYIGSIQILILSILFIPKLVLPKLNELKILIIFSLFTLLTTYYLVDLPLNSSLINKLTPLWGRPFSVSLYLSILIVIVTYVFYKYIAEILSTFQNKEYLVSFFLAAIFAITFSMLKMKDYNIGTRHMGQIALFLVLLQEKYKINYKIKAVLLSIALALGAILLVHHFYNTPSILY